MTTITLKVPSKRSQQPKLAVSNTTEQLPQVKQYKTYQPPVESISYNVCPITGISSSIKDELGHYWHEAPHPITANPKELFHRVEKYSYKQPKSVIAAAILLQLHEEELILHTSQEHKYLRGQANAMLASFPRTELIELYWDVRNTKAGLCSDPLRLNLQTSVEQGRNTVFDNIKAIGKQSVSAADMQTYIKSRSIPGILHISSKKDLDILNCLKRLRKDLKILCTELLEGGYSWDDLEIPKGWESINRIRDYLWKDKTGAVYHHLNQQTKERIVEILKAIYERAIFECIIDMDSVQAKSYRIVCKHIAEGVTPHIAEVEL